MNADHENRIVELEDLVVRPGTYVNPQTEVVIVVDDSASIDQEAFEGALEGAEWIRVSDEIPVDSDALETSIEAFHTANHPGTADLMSETTRTGDDEVEEELELEPDPDPEE